MLRLDPGNEYALSNLEKLYEEQHLWNEAYATRQKLAAASPTPIGPDTRRSSRSWRTNLDVTR